MKFHHVLIAATAAIGAAACDGMNTASNDDYDDTTLAQGENTADPYATPTNDPYATTDPMATSDDMATPDTVDQNTDTTTDETTPP